MAAVEVQFDRRQIARVERELKGHRSAAKRVMRNAINRTAVGARKKLVDTIREKTPIKAKTIRQRTRIRRATNARLVAVVSITDKAIPLIQFTARETARGVTAKVRREGGRELFERAFVATMPRGYRGVFRRRRSLTTESGLVGRLKIDELFGPNLLEALGNKALNRLEVDVGDRLEREVDSQLTRELIRLGVR